MIGFPIGNSYNKTGYWVYRNAFDHLIRELIPHKLIETNAPLSTEVTVTWQKTSIESGRPERYMVHIINWSPTRKTPLYNEVHEDPIALTDIKVKLNIPFKNVTVKTVLAGEKLVHQSVNNGIEVVVKRIPIHEIICFDVIGS